MRILTDELQTIRRWLASSRSEAHSGQARGPGQEVWGVESGDLARRQEVVVKEAHLHSQTVSIVDVEDVLGSVTDQGGAGDQ